MSKLKRNAWVGSMGLPALGGLLAVLGLACANLSPEAARLGTALLTAVGENYGGKYYQEVKQFYDTMNAASNGALAQILVPQGGAPVQTASASATDAGMDAGAGGMGDGGAMADAGAAGEAGAAAEASAQPDESAPGEAGGGMDASGTAGDPNAMAAAASAAPEAAGAGVPIELDVAVMKRVVDAEGERIVALENGDVIQDGNGDPNAGDQMQVFFRPNVQAWVYVVAVDATGWVQPMFPSAFPDAQNPLPAGSTTLIPGEGAWFGLDQYKGTEHIYFVASEQPRPDLEAQLAAFAGQERPENADPVPVGVPAVVEEAFIQARGFTGIRPGQATTYAAKPTTFTFGIPGVDLVVTRYFEHR